MSIATNVDGCLVRAVSGCPCRSWCWGQELSPQLKPNVGVVAVQVTSLGGPVSVSLSGLSAAARKIQLFMVKRLNAKVDRAPFHDGLAAAFSPSNAPCLVVSMFFGQSCYLPRPMAKVATAPGLPLSRLTTAWIDRPDPDTAPFQPAYPRMAVCSTYIRVQRHGRFSSEPCRHTAAPFR